jgi:signal transduction histidine kinase
MNALSDKLEETISELKTANNELQLDLQRRTEQEEMRQEFLANVSHELKTPIALIQGYAEGLQENINEDVESREFYCEVIVDEANKMNKMVKRLLSLNQLEFGNGQVHLEHFDLNSVLDSVVNATDILFKQKEVTLSYQKTDNPVMVWADEYMIEEVVTNYVSNALNHVKYDKKIEIKAISDEEVVRVSVFNTGDPIPETELDKIWSKFYKVDKARTREYGGNGIGLSIVKAVMEAHNQKYGVKNYDNGVEFWFELDSAAKLAAQFRKNEN